MAGKMIRMTLITSVAKKAYFTIIICEGKCFYLSSFIENNMRQLYKYLIKLIATLLFIFLYRRMHTRSPRFELSGYSDGSVLHWGRDAISSSSSSSLPIVYLWCTVVKIEDSNSIIARKFEVFVKSLAQHSNRSLSLNILTDKRSEVFANRVISAVNVNVTGGDTGENGSLFHRISFYDIDVASKKIKPIVRVMRQYFSSMPGTYYSDSLFYVSLGLHKIAPQHHDRVILLDIDIKFEKSIFSLFEKFSELVSISADNIAAFGNETLFGLAPELTPVYRHILWKWKRADPFSQFGEPSYRGYSGLNSGVMLMKLNAIRESEEYSNCITRAYLDHITSKYFFKGHLGDQDFYTLLKMEKPHLITILPCTWNRQLCLWWKHHGYADVFDDFARCSGEINIYHGNCNTPIPIK